MAIGLPQTPRLDAVPGIKLSATRAGINKADKDDLALITCAPSTVASAVFTKNLFCAAPVIVAQHHLNQCSPRALIINSGNANAGTGIRGRQDAELVCELVAGELGFAKEAVLPFSTGVIGARLPVPIIHEALPECVRKLGRDKWLAVAKAMMTTDTVPKGVSRRFKLGDTDINLTGIVKGSGMIHPNMATMLGFVAIDAAVTQPVLDQLIRQATIESFNRITVDGDTSTNDACVLLATSCADMKAIEHESDQRYAELARNIGQVFVELAQSLIRDGEGATKFVSIEVNGAATDQDAQKLAFAIAHSPLVKTALFASDPNWGRILAVIGRVDIDQLEISKVGICINDIVFVVNGELADTYTEQAGQEAMAPENIHVKIDLGSGKAEGVVWTTDFSYDYVKINAEYRS